MYYEWYNLYYTPNFILLGKKDRRFVPLRNDNLFGLFFNISMYLSDFFL